MKLHNLISCIAAATAIFLTAACSGFDANADLDAADQAIAAGEYSSAQAICNSLMTKHEAQLSATQFARLSMLFMQLTDKADDGTDATHAATCWIKAMKLDPDSATLFYSSVPVDQQKNVVLLNAIVSMFNHNDEIPGLDSIDSEMADSLPDFPDDIDIDPNDHHDHD